MPRPHRPLLRALLLFLGLLVMPLAVLGVPGTASGVTPTLGVTDVQPANTAVANQIFVERVAPTTAATAATWRLNMDMTVKNTGSASFTISSVTVSYPGTSIAAATYGVAGMSLTPSQSKFLIVPENRRFAFPVAPKVRVQFNVSGKDPIAIERTLKEYKNKTPSGGYRFPAAAVSGGYWRNAPGHDVGSHHRNVRNQRFAYDLHIMKWDGDSWESRKPGTTGSNNTDSWVFGTPIYAMADGVIKKCRRDQVDNVPGVLKPDPEVEGNHLYIQHAVGEVALYAHFKAGSPSTTLCPAAAATDLNIPVTKGQFLGYSGNTGNSSGPHLHLHLGDAVGFWKPDSKPVQGLPLLFDHALTRTKAGYTPTTTPGFAALTNSSEAAIPHDSFIQPNRCGFHRVVGGQPEWARHNVSIGCYQEEFEDIALAGYRPVWRNQFQNGGNSFVSSIWRPRAGLAWAARHGQTAAQHQATFNTYSQAGYRPTNIDSYLENGVVKYSSVWTKQSGVAYRAYHGVSQATHQSRFNTWTAQGYRPTQISVVYVNGARQFTAVYELKSIGSYSAQQTIAESSYQTVYNQQASAGRRPLYIDVYREGTINRFSVIFSSTVPSTSVARHNLTSAQYQTEYNTWRGTGRLTQFVAGYLSGGVSKYAALWR